MTTSQGVCHNAHNFPTRAPVLTRQRTKSVLSFLINDVIELTPGKKVFGGQIICPGIILLEFGELIDFELVFILSVSLDRQIPIQAAVMRSLAVLKLLRVSAH